MPLDTLSGGLEGVVNALEEVAQLGQLGREVEGRKSPLTARERQNRQKCDENGNGMDWNSGGRMRFWRWRYEGLHSGGEEGLVAGNSVEHAALRLARRLAILRGSMRGEARVVGHRMDAGERWAEVLVQVRGVSVEEREAIFYLATTPVEVEED